MRKTFTLLLFFTLTVFGLNAQMWNGVDTLYGNEWIRYDQQYFKVKVAKDGVYRIPYQSLSNAGFPVSSIAAAQYQLFHMGQEVPIYVSAEGTMDDGDFIEFYGVKNRSELDRYLFLNPEEQMLNPYYSLYTDTSAYFLTWVSEGEPTLRYQTIENDLTNLPAKEEWFPYVITRYFKDDFDKKYVDLGEEIRLSSFDIGEGFGKGFPGSNQQTISFSPPALNTSGQEASLRVRFSCGVGAHQQQILVNGTEYFNESFSGYQVIEETVENIPLSDNFNLTLNGLAGSSDQQNLALTELTYPRSFDFGGSGFFSFILNNATESKYLEIENFDIDGGVPVLLDLVNNQRHIATVEDNLVKVKLLSTDQERQLVLVNSETGIQMIGNLEPVSFTDFSELNGEYLIISNSRLFDDGNGNNRVQEYADYRASVDGGGYNTVIVDIDQLIDQFAYGVKRHPLSIRNFGHYVKKQWPNPQFVLIIGKGSHYDTIRVRTDQQIASYYFVPTFGTPPSDNLLLAATYSDTPVIPVGRIAAKKFDQVKNYLEKVKDLEANYRDLEAGADRSWMKNVMHLGGGSSPEEKVAIKGHLEDLENQITNNFYGANVRSFFKTSSDPVQLYQSEQVFDFINNGVSLITFFGHSGTNSFDLNIDNPEMYDNKGKTPLIVSLGCFSGNIHKVGHTSGEQFCFRKDNGASAFLASSSFAVIPYLKIFAGKIYQDAGGTQYGSSIGEVLNSTINSFSGSGGAFKAMIQQFTLHGDPALKLNMQEGPDYWVDYSSATFDPAAISVQRDSFELSFDIKNTGKNVLRSLPMELSQELPNGVRQVLKRDTISAPALSETLTYRLPTLGKEAVGLNTIFIKLDEGNDIEEAPLPGAETNNEVRRPNGQLGIPVFFLDNTAMPVSPNKFGIVPYEDIVLKASTTDMLAPERTYIMEIDTTARFNSAAKKKTLINQGGGIISWEPPVNWNPNTVYYWRVSPDSVNNESGFAWEESSFIYLPDESEGWNQSDYYQYKSGELEGLTLEEEDRYFRFLNDYTEVRIINRVRNSAGSPQYFSDGEPWGSPFNFNVESESVNVVVLDSATVIHMKNNAPGEHGASGPSSGFLKAFPFKTNNQANREKLIKFLENIIPNGNYVIVYSAQGSTNASYYPEQWAQDSVALGKNIFSILEEQGATKLRQLEQTGSIPFVFIYQKGNGTAIREEVADDLLGVIDITQEFEGFWKEGIMDSPIIGPAVNWDRLEYGLKEVNNPENDISKIKIYGLNPSNGITEIIKEGIVETSTSLSEIDASEYPYLKLEWYAYDNDNRTAPQLDYWRVFYEGLPEAAVNPAGHYVLQRDTLSEGEPFSLAFAIENIGSYDMDSLLVKFVAEGDQEPENQTIYKRFGPLSKGEMMIADFALDTKGRGEGQDIRIEVNPDEDQPEWYHFNNLLNTDFHVIGDNENPLLDVTFDGIHILNGDIVSSRPYIVVTLEDENQYLELGDTSLFNLFLRYPAESTPRRIYFDQESITFFPASPSNLEQKNRATIEYRPSLAVDGTYELMVQAEDASGNASGQRDYQISFKVVNKATISNMLNYPNPFSTSTRFVYTLTGSEPPTFFKLQIMTVSGRIVREITQDEMGPLKIGTHRTDFAWDGRDEFGDRLANGVYLYRIVAKDANGKDFGDFDEVEETNTDRFFKNQIGKMVILR